jgi:hypothetical protein
MDEGWRGDRVFPGQRDLGREGQEGKELSVHRERALYIGKEHFTLHRGKELFAEEGTLHLDNSSYYSLHTVY